MIIDVKKINEELLDWNKLTNRQKEFGMAVLDLKEDCYKRAKEEIDGIVEKYAHIEANAMFDLYNKFRNDKEVGDG